jgi:CubicO group peptidase (beta-lactamase class C family)
VLFLNSTGVRSQEQGIDKIVFSRGFATESVVIQKGGAVVYERYKAPINASTKHIAWSITKSVTTTILGALVEAKRIDLNASICQYSATARDKSRCSLRIADFASWSSGLMWNEAYENKEGGSFSDSSVGQLLYGDGAPNTLRFILSHKKQNEPGRVYSYSTGDSTALMGILQESAGKGAADLPWTMLFNPLGITNVTFEPDLAGNYFGGGSLFITARDLAKIGQLYAQGGMWKGKRLLPENWNAYVSAAPEAYQRKPEDKNSYDPGHGWWKFHSSYDRKIPADTLVARGHWGQFLVVIPSLDLVVVRMANDRGETNFGDKQLAELVIAAINETGVR